MPFLLPAAATAVAAAPAAAAAATATAGATLTSIATNVAMNLAISAAMSALQPNVGTAGRTSEWTLSPDGPIPFAAGRIGVAGSVVHRSTFGPDLMYFGVPSVVSGAGPIDGYESFRADDEPVAFDGAGKAISSQYANELWFKRSLGHQPDVAITTPAGLKNNATLPGWGAAHRLSGKAAYMVVMGENSKGTAFPTGEIKPLIVVRGLKGWDPRLDSTWPGGEGPCLLHDPATWVYLRRPGLWALKWALGLWEGPTLKGAPAHGSNTDYQVGGIGAKLSGIDVQAFITLENICDANDWTVSAYPTTDDDKFAVLESFLQAGGATYASRAGKISCIQRGAPRTSIVTIGAGDTAGPLEIDTAASRIDRINTIRPRIMSEGHRWQLTAITEVSADAYREEDGGTRPRGIDYTYVDQATQGAQLAALQVANTREGIAGVIPLKPHLQKIRPGDAFTITEPGFVLNGLKCLCLTTDFDPQTKIVAVSFVSETDAKYPFALGQTQDPPEAPVLEPVDPRFVSPPGEVEWEVIVRPPAESGAQVPGFDLVGEVDNATATAILVEWGASAEGPWTQAYLGPPTAERIPLTGIQPNATYYVSVMNIRGQNYSARRIYGPFTAGALISDDTQKVDGLPSVDLKARLISAEALGEANSAAVDDLVEVFGDTESAAASALAADASAQNAQLERIAAQAAREGSENAASASVTQAGIATAKATEAGEEAAAAQAAQVAARLTYKATVLVGGNQHFENGLTGWNWTAAQSPIPDDGRIVVQPDFHGRANVAVTEAGIYAPIYTERFFELEPNRYYRFRSAIYMEAPASGEFYIGFQTFDSSGATVGGNNGHVYALAAGYAAAGVWHDFVTPAYRPSTDLTAGTAKVRLLALINFAGTAGSVSGLDGVWVEDVTEMVLADASASAAATSASNALASEGIAGAHAAASQGWAVQAGTKAGEAEAFRNQSASSAADAQEARDAAGTHVANAATEAATATFQASLANDARAEAQLNASIAASVSVRSLHPGSRFVDFSPARQAARAGIPDGWHDWSRSVTGVSVEGEAGGYAYRQPTSDGVGVSDNGINHDSGPVLLPNTWYVTEARIRLDYGKLIGAGLLSYSQSSPGVFDDFDLGTMAFDSYPDASGVVHGAGVPGKTYSFSRMDKSSPTASISRLYAMSHYTGFSNPNAVPSSITWFQASIRPATPEEIAAGTVLPAVAASVEVNALAIADVENRLSEAAFDVTAAAGGDPAMIWLKANGTGSAAGLIASVLRFGTIIGGAVHNVMTLIGDSVHISGKLFVGAMKEIGIDPTLPGIIWTFGGARLLIGGVPNDNLFFWFGPSVAPAAMFKNNATLWLDRTGNAYFGGALSAGTLTTKAATSSQAANAEVETATFGSNGDAIHVTLSYSFLQANAASGTDFTPPPNDGGTNGGATIELLRSVGGGAYSVVTTLNAPGTWSWTYEDLGDVPGETNWTGTGQSSLSGSLTFTDPALSTADRRYKARLTGRAFQNIGGGIEQLISIIAVEE